MQASPISARVGHLPVVIGGGKMGYVYEMDADSGKLLWKTPVGEHNGHDDDSLKALDHDLTLKAPYTILPGIARGRADQHGACRGQRLRRDARRSSGLH